MNGRKKASFVEGVWKKKKIRKVLVVTGYMVENVE
jgi:hypothetical protein